MRGRKEAGGSFVERAEKLEANLLAFMETAEGLVYSLDRNFRYINLNSALKNGIIV